MLSRALVTLLLSSSCAFAAQATFHKDVLPILQARCQSCHRPGEAAPFPLLSYVQARPWAKAMREAVVLRKMPPWFADPSAGHFRNDRRLSQGEIDTLVAWADAGAPEGNSADAPPPAKFTDGWTIGKPDAVLEMPQAFDVPPNGLIDYQWILIRTGFTGDKWIQAFECRPGERAVVHHIGAFWRRPGSPWMADAKPGVPIAKPTSAPENGASDGLVGDYVPGMPGLAFPPGYAMLLPAGADIMLQVHYTPNGKPARDISRVGFVFASQPPQHRVVNVGVTNMRFRIPPKDPSYRVDAQLTLGTEAQLLVLNPHMHVRGKAFEIRAVREGAEPEMLLRVPRYDFNWQLNYIPTDPLRFPAGTRVEATAWYDNSPNNPYNPDPQKEVGFGAQTSDEMMVGFLHLAVPAGTDMRKLFQRPAAYTRPAAGTGTE
jgi:hypothetical protein